ncbi:hypothetical protein DE146DRAFT_733321 [Phaeosphaeria sp. MPI-PUGE-AT-0046c]|nr:hypothetical protein DE146DRAFT_733321 [Phaeosphaeria sp. MPI-PUGE-AT-0046c]
MLPKELRVNGEKRRVGVSRRRPRARGGCAYEHQRRQGRMQTCMFRVPDSSVTVSARIPECPGVLLHRLRANTHPHSWRACTVPNKHAAKHTATVRNIINVQKGRQRCRLAARCSRFGLVAVVVSTAGYEWPMSKLATDRRGCKRKPSIRSRPHPILEHGSYGRRDDSYAQPTSEQPTANLWASRRRVNRVGCQQTHLLRTSTQSSIVGKVIVCPSHSAQNSSTGGSTAAGLWAEPTYCST